MMGTFALDHLHTFEGLVLVLLIIDAVESVQSTLHIAGRLVHAVLP